MSSKYVKLDESKKGSVNTAPEDVSLDSSSSDLGSSKSMNFLQDEKSEEGHFTWDMAFVFKTGSPSNKVRITEDSESIKVPMRDPKTGKHKYVTQKIPKRKVEIINENSIFHVHSESKGREISEESYFRRGTAVSIRKLREAGLETLCYYSIGKDEIYCLVGAKEARLKREAERIQFDLLLNPDGCIDAGLKLNPPLVLALRTAEAEEEEAAVVTRNAWLSMYGKYDQKKDEQFPNLYKLWDTDYVVLTEQGAKRERTLFRTFERLKLIRSIVEADKREGGAGLKLNSVNKGVHPLVACFPLHQQERLSALEAQWKSFKQTIRQPLEAIREYFGEHVAFYYAFLETYNRWLILAAFLGVISFIVQLGTGEIDNAATALFGFFMGIYTAALLEKWKRRQSEFRTEWGQWNFLEREQPRAEFEGVWQPSPVDGRLTEIFPYHIALRRKICSQSVIWSLITIVVGTVASIFVLRGVLVRWNEMYGGIVSGILNSIQIQIMNLIYSKVAVKLNDWENHRTQTEYENNLISKSFLFKFVNSYNSLFYIAFFKRFDVGDGCAEEDPTCLYELQTQLATIFVTQMVVSNAIELFMPWFAGRSRRLSDEGRGALTVLPKGYKDRTQAEKEYALEPYDSTFSDFDEIVIQYGYTTLFVVAFPLTPLLSLISNYIETRLDSYKLLHLQRRPHPRGAYNIGTWFSILDILGTMACVTNIALVMFVSSAGDYLSKDNNVHKFLLFFLFEHFALLAKYLIGFVIPDTPHAISEHLERQTHVVDVLIRDAEEEEEKFKLEDLDGKDDHTSERRQLETLPLGVDEPAITRHQSNPSRNIELVPGRFTSHYIV